MVDDHKQGHEEHEEHGEHGAHGAHGHGAEGHSPEQQAQLEQLIRQMQAQQAAQGGHGAHGHAAHDHGGGHDAGHGDGGVDGLADSQYVTSQVAGHGLGAVASTVGTYMLESAGYGLGGLGSIAGLSVASEAMDFAGDQVGFNTARYGFEGGKEKYKGITGKIQYVADSAKYAVKHVKGNVFSRVATPLIIFGASAGLGWKVYAANLAARVVEPVLDIASNYFFTKKLRKGDDHDNAHGSHQPAYAGAHGGH